MNVSIYQCPKCSRALENDKNSCRCGESSSSFHKVKIDETDLPKLTHDFLSFEKINSDPNESTYQFKCRKCGKTDRITIKN